MIAQAVREEIKEAVQKKTTKKTPGLAVILVGEDPASKIYVRNKRKMCDAVGFYAEQYTLPADSSESEVMYLVEDLNQNPKIDGILVQLPLPKHIDSSFRCCQPRKRR